VREDTWPLTWRRARSAAARPAAQPSPLLTAGPYELSSGNMASTAASIRSAWRRRSGTSSPSPGIGGGLLAYSRQPFADPDRERDQKRLPEGSGPRRAVTVDHRAVAVHRAAGLRQQGRREQVDRLDIGHLADDHAETQFLRGRAEEALGTFRRINGSAASSTRTDERRLSALTVRSARSRSVPCPPTGGVDQEAARLFGPRLRRLRRFAARRCLLVLLMGKPFRYWAMSTKRL
jgi:hypothetical protein